MSNTNISGHNIYAGPGAVVGTDRARVNTGTHIERSKLEVHQSIDDALDCILEAIRESSLSDEKKYVVKGLAEDIRDEKKEKGMSARMGVLISNLVNLAKEVGPVTKSVAEAISVLQKFRA